MSNFSTQQFTEIEGISDLRRLPNVGKIKQGTMFKKGEVSYPVELPAFKLPEEVAKKCGGFTVERAKEMGVTRKDILDYIENNGHNLAESLEIMFPMEDKGAVFPHNYRWYGKQKGVKCVGNGKIARRGKEDGTTFEMECPCENLKSKENPKGECSHRGDLMFFIPSVSIGGVYQLPLGSFHSIVDINSGLDYVASPLMAGRFAMVPLTLKRVKRETHHDNKKQIHFTIQIILDITVDMLNTLRANTQKVLTASKFALPPVKDINPEMDVDEVIEIEGEEIIDGKEIIEEMKEEKKEKAEKKEFKGPQFWVYEKHKPEEQISSKRQLMVGKFCNENDINIPELLEELGKESLKMITYGELENIKKFLKA